MGTAQNRVTILVIDDDPDMRVLLEGLLISAGYVVDLASDGKQGVAHLRTQRPELVLTDLFMPNQEGLETIIQLHKEFPNIPIIAMTGKTAGKPLLPVAQKLGAVAFLEKPFTADEFLSAVSKALESRPERKRSSSTTDEQAPA